jgi:hypothetical protein
VPGVLVDRAEAVGRVTNILEHQFEKDHLWVGNHLPYLRVVVVAAGDRLCKNGRVAGDANNPVIADQAL